MSGYIAYKIIETPCCSARFWHVDSLNFNDMEPWAWTDGRSWSCSASTWCGGLRKCICGEYYSLHDVKTVSRSFSSKPCSHMVRKILCVPKRSFITVVWSKLQALIYPKRLPEAVRDESYAGPVMPDLPHSIRVNNEELQNLQAGKMPSSSVEIAIRRLYWRYLNDSFRDAYVMFRESHIYEVDEEGNIGAFPRFFPSEEQTQNMQKLVKLLEKESNPKWLEIAELYRELGDMEAASIAFAYVEISKKIDQTLYVLTKKLIALKICCPVKITWQLEAD